MNFAGKLWLLFFVSIYNIQTINCHSRNWWKYTTIYEIYIWSFMDSNGDGVGDINGINLLLDFVINHSSDKHLWFQKSINRTNPYTDYYVWKDPKAYTKNGSPIPPNNWQSVFTGSAWHWNEKRKQFYLHQFAETQPDLNLRNPILKAELKSIIKFWFDKGVAGFRLDAAEHFMEDSEFRDEPCEDHDITDLECHNYKHIRMINLWENYELLHEFREYIDANYRIEDIEKILITEAYTDRNHTMAYYGTKNYKVVHFPFNFDFTTMNTFPRPKDLDDNIKSWLSATPAYSAANWVPENHDNIRIGSRLQPEFMDIIVIIVNTLPGVACMYYGQEIGMMDYKVRSDQIRDPNNDAHFPPTSRDPERLPMQWDDSLNAGFSSNPKPWLPVNPDYWHVNVEAQKKHPQSRYHMYKTLSKLRKTNTLKHGNFRSYIISSWVYAFSRNLVGEVSYITIINLGTETEIIQLHHNIPRLPPFVTVVAASINAGYKKGNRVWTHPKFPQNFVLRPMSAVVVSTA